MSVHTPKVEKIYLHYQSVNRELLVKGLLVSADKFYPIPENDRKRFCRDWQPCIYQKMITLHGLDRWRITSIMSMKVFCAAMPLRRARISAWGSHITVISVESSILFLTAVRPGSAWKHFLKPGCFVSHTRI